VFYASQKLSSSKKYPYPPQGRLLEISREGVSKVIIFKGKYEAKLEFSEGWEGEFKLHVNKAFC